MLSSREFHAKLDSYEFHVNIICMCKDQMDTLRQTFTSLYGILQQQRTTLVHFNINMSEIKSRFTI